MRRTHGLIWLVVGCALLAACGAASAPATSTAAPSAATGGTRVAAFVSTLVPRPTDPPTPTAAPTNTPAPTFTRAVNTITALPTNTPRPGVTVRPTITPGGPTSTPRPTITPRPTSTPNAFTGSSTSVAMGGTREFVAPGARFRLRYPEAWTAGPQGSTTYSISPERGSDRIAGFLIEPVAFPSKNTEADLRDALDDSSPGMALTVTKEPFPTTVDGAAGFRADFRAMLPAPTPTRGPTTPVTIIGGTPGMPNAGPMVTYVGSFLVVERNGLHYRMAVIAREGDADTLRLAEEVLASLRFT